jgi:hypothetical protein
MVPVDVEMRTRSTPAHVSGVSGGTTRTNGPTREVRTGSVRTTRPASSMRTVECPRNRIVSPYTELSIRSNQPGCDPSELAAYALDSGAG